ncbi:hypothetical protein NPIL_692881 [Nephila pilipes]|uniref:Uncharacterized protein n=1 Tax=Nephila pilipes TaxID=299642 RepID=A0A8X6UCP1_NEPPI|nr:hypothetical protein NPIL_692881 [Nephila pilipes]
MSPLADDYSPSPVKENFMSPVPQYTPTPLPKPHTYTSSNYVPTDYTTTSNALQDTFMMSPPAAPSVYRSPVPRSSTTYETLRQSPNSHRNGKDDDDLESEAGCDSKPTE